MKTPLEFLYEFYPHIEKETIKNDLIRFCEAYGEYLENGKPKEQLHYLIRLRAQYYTNYNQATGTEKKIYRKQWKLVDDQIFDLVEKNYKQVTIIKYTNEIDKIILLVKTKDPLIIQVLKDKGYQFNSFTCCWEKENHDNSFFSFINNIVLYL